MDRLVAPLILTSLVIAVAWRRNRHPRKGALATVEDFKTQYAVIASELLRDAETELELPRNESAHVRRLLDYTVPGGKVNRGLTVVQTAQTLSREPLTSLQAVSALGWAVEWMQASFLVSDDMMDSSTTRRGQPCWYLVPGIGSTAINDALILLTQCELLLTRFLGSHPHLPAIRELLLDTIYRTELGQLMDLTTQPPGASVVNFSLYTMERYKHIVKYKTAFYSFVAPVRLGMLFAGISDARLHAQVSAVCLLMGEYFQVQDDFLDVFGSPEVIGKIGTDIQDAKCSWLVVTAMGLCSAKQRALLESNYGQPQPECVQIVKNLFGELALEDRFNAYEQATVTELKRMIAQVDSPGAQQVLLGLLGKIYKRDK